MSLVCDDVTIIAGGKIKDTGTISDLRKRLASRTEVNISTLKRNDKFMQYLIDHQDIIEVKLMNKHDHYIYNLQFTGKNEIRHHLLQKAIELELDPIGMEKSESSLEEIFMKVTK